MNLTERSSQNHSLSALEWGTLVEKIQNFCITEPAFVTFELWRDQSNWAQSPAHAQELQHQTQMAYDLLEQTELWASLRELKTIDTALKILEKKGVLEIHHLFYLHQWLKAMRVWAEAHTSPLATHRESFEPLQNLLKICFKILTDDGQMSEQASPQLFSIHQDLKRIKREIEKKMLDLVRDYHQQGLLQENYSDIRDGRYVIPVKASSQNEIEGTIFDLSATRQTVFVEPQAITQLNNRLQQKQNECVQEIYRILEQVSKDFSQHVATLEFWYHQMVLWDQNQAKARFAIEVGGQPIDISPSHEFKLTQTAHPLLFFSLPKNQIIRNSLHFGGETRSLLITGPNTGGKTVLLKTLGLSVLCSRTGLFFPGSIAFGAHQVPWIEQVFVDLGDEQSIQSQLSSFSSHLKRFKEILEEVSNDSLVLMDELNTATDPEEGSALGRACLETIMEKGALVISTTHDPLLKVLALNDTRILNASMNFNEDSRMPSYELLMGVPGRSRALETAERLGLPTSVITRARSYLSTQHQHFEDYLSKIEKDAHLARTLREESEKILANAKDYEQELKSKIKTQLQDRLESIKELSRELIQETRTQVQLKLHEIRQAQNEQKALLLKTDLLDLTKKLEIQFQEKVETSFSEHPDILQPSETQTSQRAPLGHLNQNSETTLKLGDTVRIPSWKTTGKITDLLGNPITHVKVLMGILSMKLPIEEIELLSASEKQKSTKASRTTLGNSLGHSGNESPASLDLRGQRFEEAMSELAAFVDFAYRSKSHAEVTIIHGVGTGALREGTKKFLKQLPYVKAERDGGKGSGGAGATIIEFDYGN
jgi:DNA mismatch repair protein MutS2